MTRFIPFVMCQILDPSKGVSRTRPTFKKKLDSLAQEGRHAAYKDRSEVWLKSEPRELAQDLRIKRRQPGSTEFQA